MVRQKHTTGSEFAPGRVTTAVSEASKSCSELLTSGATRRSERLHLHGPQSVPQILRVPTAALRFGPVYAATESKTLVDRPSSDYGRAVRVTACRQSQLRHRAAAPTYLGGGSHGTGDKTPIAFYWADRRRLAVVLQSSFCRYGNTETYNRLPASN